MKHNILFLDDNETLTALIADYLDRHGYSVYRAASVAQATASLSRRVYSMVLIDVRLAGDLLAGFEFACRLQESSPWMPFMLFSSCISPQLELETARRKMKLISKPKPLVELKAIIDEYLQSKYSRLSTGSASPVAVA